MKKHFFAGSGLSEQQIFSNGNDIYYQYYCNAGSKFAFIVKGLGFILFYPLYALYAKIIG
jgi:hypothetical protein